MPDTSETTWEQVGTQGEWTAFAPAGYPRDASFFGGEPLYYTGGARQDTPGSFVAADPIFRGDYVPNDSGRILNLAYKIGDTYRPALQVNPNNPKQAYYFPRAEYDKEALTAQPEATGEEAPPESVLAEGLKRWGEPYDEETQKMIADVRVSGIFGRAENWMSETAMPLMAHLDVLRGAGAEGVVASYKKYGPLSLVAGPLGAAVLGWGEMRPEARAAALDRAWRGQSPSFTQDLTTRAHEIQNPIWRGLALAGTYPAGMFLDALSDPLTIASFAVSMGEKVPASAVRAESLRTVTALARREISKEAAERVASRLGKSLSVEGIFASAIVDRQPKALARMYRGVVQAFLPEVGDISRAEALAEAYMPVAADRFKQGVRVLGRRQSFPWNVPDPINPDVYRSEYRRMTTPREPTPRPTVTPQEAAGVAGRAEAPPIAPAPAAAAPVAAEGFIGGPVGEIGDSGAILRDTIDATRRQLTDARAAVAAGRQPSRPVQVLEEHLADFERQLADLGPQRTPVSTAAPVAAERAAGAPLAPLQGPIELRPGADILASKYGTTPERMSIAMRNTSENFTWGEARPTPVTRSVSTPAYGQTNGMTDALQTMRSRLTIDLDRNQREALFYRVQTGGDPWTPRFPLRGMEAGQVISFTPEESLTLLLKQTGEWRDGINLASLMTPDGVDIQKLNGLAPRAAKVEAAARQYSTFFAKAMTDDNPIGVSIPHMMEYLNSVGDPWAVSEVGSLGRGYMPRVGGRSVSDSLAGRVSPIGPQPPPLAPGGTGRFAYHSTYTRPLDEIADAAFNAIDPHVIVDPETIAKRYTRDWDALYQRYTYLRSIIGEPETAGRAGVEGRAVRILDDNGQRIPMDYNRLEREGYEPLRYRTGERDPGTFVGPLGPDGQPQAAYLVPHAVQVEFEGRNWQHIVNNMQGWFDHMGDLFDSAAVGRGLRGVANVADDLLRLGQGAAVVAYLATRRFAHANTIEQMWNWYMGVGFKGAKAGHKAAAGALLKEIMGEMEMAPGIGHAIPRGEAWVSDKLISALKNGGMNDAEAIKLLKMARENGVIHTGMAGEATRWLKDVGEDSALGRLAGQLMGGLAEAERAALTPFMIGEDYLRLLAYAENIPQYGAKMGAAKTFEGFVNYSTSAYPAFIQAMSGYMLFLRYPLMKGYQVAAWGAKHPGSAALIGARLMRRPEQTAAAQYTPEQFNAMGEDMADRGAQVWADAAKWGRRNPWDPTMAFEWYPERTLPEGTSSESIQKQFDLPQRPDRRVFMYGGLRQVPSEVPSTVAGIAEDPYGWLMNHLAPPFKFTAEFLKTGSPSQAWGSVAPNLFGSRVYPTASQRELIQQQQNRLAVESQGGTPIVPLHGRPNPNDVVISLQRQSEFFKGMRSAGVVLRNEEATLANIPLPVLQRMVDNSVGLPDEYLPFPKPVMEAYLWAKLHGVPNVGGSSTGAITYDQARRRP